MWKYPDNMDSRDDVSTSGMSCKYSSPVRSPLNSQYNYDLKQSPTQSKWTWPTEFQYISAVGNDSDESLWRNLKNLMKSNLDPTNWSVSRRSLCSSSSIHNSEDLRLEIESDKLSFFGVQPKRVLSFSGNSGSRQNLLLTWQKPIVCFLWTNYSQLSPPHVGGYVGFWICCINRKLLQEISSVENWRHQRCASLTVQCYKFMIHKFGK